MTVFPRVCVGLAGLFFLAACGEGDAPPQAEISGGTEIGAPGRPQTVDEATDGPSDVALFRVSDEDTVLYILGTVHFMNAGLDWKTEKIKTAFDQADTIYLEADMFSKEAQRAMGVLVSESAELRGEFKLSSFYEQKDKAALDEKLATVRANLSRLDSYRPWFAAMQIETLGVLAAGGDPAADPDVVIGREAVARDIPLRYLETAATRLSALAAGDDRRDAAYFYDLASKLSEGEVYYADLLGAWYEGDLERVDGLLNDIYDRYPQLESRVLIDRNRAWAQQLDRVMADRPGTHLVVVGAEHIVGDASLQEQLRARGYDPVRL